MSHSLHGYATDPGHVRRFFLQVSALGCRLRCTGRAGTAAGEPRRVAGELTADSTAEQASAGLDQCSKVEYERFQALNDAYKEKFGFPFVMAVRDSSRDEILDAFSARLKNDYDLEFETALEEIHKIARLRLEAMEGNT